MDFVNSSDEVLKAFASITTATRDVTDPNLIYDLRAKLDATGHYQDYEVERVVKVELNPASKQGDLVAAITPVADRLLKAFKGAKEALAQAGGDEKAVRAAKDEMDALTLFKGDCAAYVRLYAFLSQVFDYGNGDIEKRFMFFKRLVPLLEFGRERDGVDTSSLVLTHHHIKNDGKIDMPLGHGEKPKLAPVWNRLGAVQDEQKALLSEIIAKVNDLFEGELTDDDKLVYVNNVLKGKLLESEELQVARR